MNNDLSPVTYPSPGCLIEFLNGNTALPAWVLETQSGALRVYALNKRELKLPLSRLLPWLGPKYPAEASRQVMDQTLEKHQLCREEIARGFDPLALWELVQDEVRKAEAAWLAEIIWPQPDCDQIAGLGRALINCKTRFRFQPPHFEIYTREQAENREHEARLAKEREEILACGRDFFAAVWASARPDHKNALPDFPARLSEGARERLKNLLLTRISRPEDQESDKIFSQMSKGLPQNAHLPLLLAQAWGILPRHADHYLLEAAYDEGDGWSAAHSQAIDELRGLFHSLSAAARPFEGPAFHSIDAPSTLDIDDALALEKKADGTFQVTLALAGPALLWPFGSALDKAVGLRATSLYLPEQDSHMLPEAIGLGLFSLKAGLKKPALLLDLRLDPNGLLLEKNLRQTWITVASNLHYEQAEDILNNDAAGRTGDPALKKTLEAALELARKLRQLRLENGAVIIERQEPVITLSGPPGDPLVELRGAPDSPAAHLIVSEMMILANTAAASWAAERDLPLIHRVQDIALPKELQGLFKKPHQAFQAIKALGNATLELKAKRHAGLGVSAYAPITSPLRRYVDLLNQAQIFHCLEGQKSRLDLEGLSAIMPLINSRLEAVGKVQRFRPRYWKLLYLKQQDPERLWPAELVEEGPAHVLLSLVREQIFVRGRKNIFGDKLFPGQRFMVRLSKIDPLANEVQVADAIEAEDVRV